MGKIDEYQNTIFETTHQPFGVSAYIPNKKISDFVGRKSEIHQFREYILTIMKSKVSLAIRLDGPAGVGKSTLFNFVKETIEREKNDEIINSYYLTEDVEILSTYFQLGDNVTGFRQLWKPILEGLKAEIEEETGFDIGFLEYLTIKLIHRLFLVDPEEISKIIWFNRPIPKELKFIKPIDILEAIYDYIDPQDLINKMKKYYDKNKRRIRRGTRVTINGEEYRLYRGDTDLIKNLFRVLDEDDTYLEIINNADEKIFGSDDELIKYYNTLHRIYSCVTQKQLIILIGIDEIAKINSIDEVKRKQYYHNLGNLLVRMRNSLKSTLFVFISTTDDWAKFDNVITKLTDLSTQLLPILKTMQLKPLSIDKAIEVFMKRMDRFWYNYPQLKDVNRKYYPFTTFFFKYIYQYNQRDLRRSIIQLEQIWSNMRFNRHIPNFESDFDVLRYVRDLDHKLLNGENFQHFEWSIIENYFEQSELSKNNTARSNSIEKGLEMAWRCYRQREFSDITAVKNNPIVRIGEKSRRPDIIIEIAGDLGLDYLRRVEFQVKAYENIKISPKVIESSVELFHSGYTDLVYFIVTGSGFNSEAEFIIEKLRMEHPNRIRTPILRRQQELMLKFLSLYDKISGWPMGSKPEEDEIVAENALIVLLGQAPEMFISTVKNLSSRGFDPTYIEEYQGIETTPTSISDFLEEETGSSQNNEHSVEYISKSVGWLQKYSFLEIYKYEIVALAQYLKFREGKRYEGKFTINTVTKNVIKRDAKLDQGNFKNLVQLLENKEILEKDKSSYVLTDKGNILYSEIKNDGFRTH